VHHVARTDPDRAGAFALAAATEALADAALDPRALDAGRVGVALGTTLGGMQLFERWMAGGEVLPAGIGAIPYYGPAVRLARALGCLGPVATAQLACASGTHAIALAADWVRAGRADVVLAGGTDLLCRFVVSGFNCLRATADVARPFAAGRRAVPVNSIKGAIGHTLGAAGAFEAILCARVLAEGRIPPTAGLDTPDPACDGLDLVMGTARTQAVEVAVSSSSGFAGTNAAL